MTKKTGFKRAPKQKKTPDYEYDMLFKVSIIAKNPMQAEDIIMGVLESEPDILAEFVETLDVQEVEN
jgi:hypothetical protein